VRPDGSSRKLGRQLESAAKAGAGWAVIVGEAADGQVILRDLRAGEQSEVPLESVAAEVNR
jgi:histidyl-tRNA synthetase